jgi:hypothetical protein
MTAPLKQIREQIDGVRIIWVFDTVWCAFWLAFWLGWDRGHWVLVGVFVLLLLASAFGAGGYTWLLEREHERVLLQEREGESR